MTITTALRGLADFIERHELDDSDIIGASCSILDGGAPSLHLHRGAWLRLLHADARSATVKGSVDVVHARVDVDGVRVLVVLDATDAEGLAALGLEPVRRTA